MRVLNFFINAQGRKLISDFFILVDFALSCISFETGVRAIDKFHNISDQDQSLLIYFIIALQSDISELVAPKITKEQF